MTGSALAVGFSGYEASVIEITCAVTGGPSILDVNALPSIDRQVATRIRLAFASIGLALPAKRIRLEVKGSPRMTLGRHCDISIAVAILAAIGIIDREDASEAVCVGSLNHEGQIKPAVGVILGAIAAKQNRMPFVFPASHIEDLAVFRGLACAPVGTITELIDYFRTGRTAVRSPTACRTLSSRTELACDDARMEQIAVHEQEILAYMRRCEMK